MANNQKTARQLRQSILMGVSIGVTIAFSFVAGFVTRDLVGASAIAASLGNSDGYLLLDEVQELIDQTYLRDQPSYQERQYAAIRGMLSSLDDPYTFFVDPPVAQSESDVLAGTYGGVGVQIQRAETGDLLLFPFDDGPAFEKGIREGDILVAIDEETITVEMRQDVIDQMLRGEVRRNNGVDITYRRDGEQTTVFVPFDVINVPSVIWRVLQEDEQLGYVQVLRFTNRTPDELKTALNELADEGIAGLILDLRNNSGGLLQESVDVASLFLDGGVIVYERDNQGENTFEADQQTAIENNLPMVVLVNGGTASAAELVAGSLLDRERGILIGQRTFGKGTVQQIFRLSDNSSLHVTSAEWLTPDRHELDGRGIEPTIAMIPDENGRDVELGEAIRYLRLELENE